MKGSQEKLFFLILELLAFGIPLYYFAVLFNHLKKIYISSLCLSIIGLQAELTKTIKTPKEVSIMQTILFFTSFVLINLGLLIEYLFNSKYSAVYEKEVGSLIKHKDPVDSLIDIANLKTNSPDMEIGKRHPYLEAFILSALCITNLFLLVHSIHSTVQSNQLILVALANIGFFIYSLGASYDLNQKAKSLKKATFKF